MTDAQIYKHVAALKQYCKDRRRAIPHACQNCILHEYHSDRWECQLDYLDLQGIKSAWEAKKKHGGYVF